MTGVQDVCSSDLHSKQTLADFVLSKFTDEDMKIMDTALENAGKAAELIVAGDIVKAMNLYN